MWQADAGKMNTLVLQEGKAGAEHGKRQRCKVGCRKTRDRIYDALVLVGFDSVHLSYILYVYLTVSMCVILRPSHILLYIVQPPGDDAVSMYISQD